MEKIIRQMIERAIYYKENLIFIHYFSEKEK